MESDVTEIEKITIVIVLVVSRWDDEEFSLEVSVIDDTTCVGVSVEEMMCRVYEGLEWILEMISGIEGFVGDW